MLNMLPPETTRPHSSGGRPHVVGPSKEAKGSSIEQAHAVPIVEEDDSYVDYSAGKSFYNWREIFPELEILYNNQAIIFEEMSKISRVSESNIHHFSLISYIPLIMLCLVGSMA